ncbi:MAG: hypothetical protein V3T98_00495 [Candidatus Paceibacterota bacterium]
MGNGRYQKAVKKMKKMEKLIDEKDFFGAFGIRPMRTPERLREEYYLPHPSGISSDGSRTWVFS